jgi:catechol 2,3-dioxygenase-like lactoylglutathione lyase family enzyme
MKQSLVHVSLVVRDYDEAIEFFTTKLDFRVVEDTFIPEQNKRWVLVSPPVSSGTHPSGTNLLLARASSPTQENAIGNQTGGRVAFFLQTDDFWRDYESMRSRGIQFRGEPRNEAYGTVAVFEDLYGNLWDLLELAIGNSG